MSDQLISLIRTYVPAAIGALIAWLATLGIDLDTQTTAALAAGTTGLATAVYYTFVRLLESRWPAIGILLGTARKPSYRIDGHGSSRPHP